MIHRVLVANDYHKKHKDVSTIEGYVRCNDRVGKSLVETIKKLNCDYFISGGDWYDRGYVDDITSALADTSMEEYISKMLNGNFYGVIGNHIRLRMDSNPELMLIQPHPTIVPRKQVYRDTPIIKTPDFIMIGKIQISLVHHKPDAYDLTDYKIVRQPETVYHVAIVHDPRWVPGFGNSSMEQISSCLKGVDFCIAADIHKPLGTIKLPNGGLIYVPGSLTNTTTDKNTWHTSVDLPLLEIDDEANTIKIQYIPFALHTNMLTLKPLKEKVKVVSMRGNFKKELYGDNQTSVIFVDNGKITMSLKEFVLQQGYTDADRKRINTILRTPSDIQALLSI